MPNLKVILSIEQERVSFRLNAIKFGLINLIFCFNYLFCKTEFCYNLADKVCVVILSWSGVGIMFTSRNVCFHVSVQSRETEMNRGHERLYQWTIALEHVFCARGSSHYKCERMCISFILCYFSIRAFRETSTLGARSERVRLQGVFTSLKQ